MMARFAFGKICAWRMRLRGNSQPKTEHGRVSFPGPTCTKHAISNASYHQKL